MVLFGFDPLWCREAEKQVAVKGRCSKLLFCFYDLAVHKHCAFEMSFFFSRGWAVWAWLGAYSCRELEAGEPTDPLSNVVCGPVQPARTRVMAKGGRKRRATQFGRDLCWQFCVVSCVCVCVNSVSSFSSLCI